MERQDRLALIENPIKGLLPNIGPEYFTAKGATYCGDARELLRQLPAESINLVMTSPPYPLVFKKEYDNVDEDDYVEWIMVFVREIQRILRKDGSFVLNLGGVWRKGLPVRSLVHYHVALEISRLMPLAQEFFWYNPAKLPAPAEWVNVRRIRVRDSVEYIWWFGKDENPKADNTRVLREYSEDMHRLIKRGIRPTIRPSGHNITQKFALDRGGSIPPNLIYAGNTDSGSEYFKKSKEQKVTPHPARFPKELPEFFIRLTTNPEDIVLDPFAGSNMTGWVAESLRRRWVSFEIDQSYVRASILRFPETSLAR